MKHIIRILLATLLGVLIAVGVATFIFMRAVTATTAALPAMVQSEFQATRGDLIQAVAKTEHDLNAQITGLRRDVSDKAGAALDRVDVLSLNANTQLTTLNTTLSAQLDRATGALAGFRQDIRPTLLATNDFTSVMFRRDALPAQTLGLLGATKVTMGEVAQTMKVVRDETPKTIQLGQTFVDYAGKTTQNVERMTRPDSWGVRAFKIVGPFVGGAVGGYVRNRK
jgi:hypothetical protein